MGYSVKGNLNACLGYDCYESLPDAFVKIYFSRNNSYPRKKKASNTIRMLPLLSQAQISDKHDMLIGSGKTDPQGHYEVQLAKTYNGGPIEIDLVIESVPKQKSDVEKVVHYHLRSLQPVWRQREDDFVYSWNYCLDYPVWTEVRSLFDAWVIFGHVISAKDKKTPLPKLKVSAYDADWIKDDFLGTAQTDDKGYFRIDYSSIDFKKTFLSPIVNVETPISPLPGPGVYFKAYSPEGAIVYEEFREDGRRPERKNIFNCFYIRLFVPIGDHKVLKSD